MDDKENKSNVYEFFKKNVLTEKMLIRILTSTVCILLLYIAGMRFIDDFNKAELPTLTESISYDISASETNTDEDNLRVNINTDNIFELFQLSGIGETKARAILEYRKENGDFLSIEELMKVPGIGEKIYDNIKLHIYVEH